MYGWPVKAKLVEKSGTRRSFFGAYPQISIETRVPNPNFTARWTMFAYYGCFLFALNGAAPLSHSGSMMVRWIRRLSLMGTVGRLQLAVTISSRLSPEIPHFLVL